MAKENAHIRKRELRQEELIDIPVFVDTDRYFIGTLKWKDLLYSVPFFILSIFIIYFLNNKDLLTTSSAVFSFLPPVIALAFLWIKHPHRTNISFVQQMWWKLKFKNSNKVFEYSKERCDEVEKDIRTQLGIYNIANDCLETLDNRLVKVIDVSSVNLTGMTYNDWSSTLYAYEEFLNDISPDIFPLQSLIFARPINLKSYLNWVDKEVDKEDNTKKIIMESYIDKVNEIQKSKNMVGKSRYLTISEKIRGNKEKSLDSLNFKTETLISSLENMLGDRYKLSAKSLNNQELFDLIYASIDYDNAQIEQDKDFESFNLPITIDEGTYKSMKEKWKEKSKERIM